MNFGQLKSAVFRRLEESEDSPVRWSEEDVELAINEGLEELSDATEFFERYATITLGQDQTYYDLRSIVPDTILRVTAIYNNTTNYWLTPTDVRDLDEKTARQWELVEGEPQRFFIRGLWWLGVFPKASSTISSIKIQYRAIHPPLVDDLDTIQQLPSIYLDAIINYALYTLLSDDMETTAALRYWGKYQEDESSLKDSCYPGSRIGHARKAGMGARL